MSDRYQSLANTPLGKLVVKNLGLPNPPILRRYREGDPLVDGTVLLGAAPGSRALGSIHKQLGTLGLATADRAADGERYRGLVFDATGIDSVAGLAALQEFFTPVLRSLRSCPRVLVVGIPPELAAHESGAVAQRALEGFTRSLAKEIGRGGTVQLLYVAPPAGDSLGSTLGFFLSPKSAYVSGQVVWVGAGGLTDAPEASDLARPLTDKVALVTGASRGIGEAIARVLHRDGATIVGLDVAQAADPLTALMTELDGSPITLDVTSPDAPQRIAAKLGELHGGVDIVVHNAGIIRDKKLANMDAERWSSVLEVNLAAPQRITDELLEQQTLRDDGRIIGVASIAGIAGNVGQTNYGASKAGVIGLVQALAPRAAARRITANAVAPGLIDTEMMAKIPLPTREVARRMSSLSQAGLPIDVAETIAWYAHPGSAAITGNVVRVCGQNLVGA
ncbi:MAG TPA: 3-oxoacyl-ACP reductase [Nocardioidaceae bacterium]|nr:3-oxoacyl-ACP reductase [Nocardioidaceae bacterium]